MGRGPAEPSTDAPDSATLARRVRTLTRVAAVLGLLAIAGIALGVYAIARDEGEASESRVERIDTSIGELERRLAAASEESDTVRLGRELDNKATKRDLQGIEEDFDTLRRSVEQADQRLDAASRRLGRMQRRLDRVARAARRER